MTHDSALLLTLKLASVATLQQSVEFLAVEPAFSERGVWRWSVLREEFAFLPRFLRGLADLLIGDRGFSRLTRLRLLVAIFLLGSTTLPALHLARGVEPAFAVFLFVSQILTSLRWRGTFNGGSDFMLTVIWTGICLEMIPGLAHAGLLYIGLQVTASYFVAGVAKLSQPAWRRGEGLASFLKTSSLHPELPSVLPAWSLVTLSFLILAFELLFPLTWLSPELAWFGISLGFGFHLVVFKLFGLNRFVLAWSAGYPALLFCSQAYGWGSR